MQTSVFIAASLDGFIARPNGSVDWLPEDCEPHGYDEFIATVDAIVIGRRTYEWLQHYLSGAGGSGWPYGSKRVTVLSSTLKELHVPPEAVCEQMAGPPREIVDQLSARGLRHLYIDGGATVQGFVRAGLIDRMIVTRIPILLGSGIPLFGPLDHDMRWKHLSTRSFPSGLVQSEYIRA